VLPPGIFGINKALSIPSNYELRGAGSAQTTLIMFTATGQTFPNPLGTPLLPSSPPPGDNCTIPAHSQLTPATAIYNPGNTWFRRSFKTVNHNQTCGTVTDIPAPDTSITLRGLTVDCNAGNVWGGFQTTGSSQAPCLFWDNLDGLTMDDVIEQGGTMDGIALGVSELVQSFIINNSSFNSNGRFGISWGAAAFGEVVGSNMLYNCGGGLDKEGIAGAPDSGGNVTFSNDLVSGPKAAGCTFGPDHGFIITFNKGDTTPSIHFAGVTIQNLTGNGIMFTRSGDYSDISFDGTIKDVQEIAIYSDSSVTGSGSVSISGQLINCGEGGSTVYAPITLGSGYESGWRVGPLLIAHSPIFRNAHDIILGLSGTPGFSQNQSNVFSDIQDVLSCTGSGCAVSGFAYVYGGFAAPTDFKNGTGFGYGASNHIYNSRFYNLNNP
jgi:hypothetical protein